MSGGLCDSGPEVVKRVGPVRGPVALTASGSFFVRYATGSTNRAGFDFQPGK